MSKYGITSVDIETAPVLAGNNFAVNRGWDSDLAQRIVHESHARFTDQSAINRTPRLQTYEEDAKGQFANYNEANRWYLSEDRVVYSLAHSAHLAAILWFTHGHPADSDAVSHQIGYREYVDFSDPIVRQEFWQTAHDDFDLTELEHAGTLFETARPKDGLFDTAEAAGYKIVNQSARHFVMTRTVEK